MTQLTFWNANYTDEHVTLAFADDGYVWHLTRDETKSVSQEWQMVGRTWRRDGTQVVRFDKLVPHLVVAATQLKRKGASVRGCGWYGNGITVASAITDRVTDPETLLGTQRKRSLNLGDTSKGERGASEFGARYETNVSAMRAAIMAR